ncbi:MAG: transposase [Roseiflexaceae bacterium]
MPRDSAASGRRSQKKPQEGGEPAAHALGRSRGGFGSNLQLLCDRPGLPLAALVLAGQQHESTQFEALMNQVRLPQRRGRRGRPRRLLADRAYSA